MIHSASYFQPENHRGILIPISRGIPSRVGKELELDWSNPLRELLAPSKDLLRWYDSKKKIAKKHGWGFPNHYIQRVYKASYKEEIRPNIRVIRNQLKNLALCPADYTLLCWEKKGEFCHRSLILMCVWSWFPTGLGEHN